MEARQGRNPAGGSMRSTTARPAISQVAGDAQQSLLQCQCISISTHDVSRMIAHGGMLVIISVRDKRSWTFAEGNGSLLSLALNVQQSYDLTN